jgi:PTS system nitrogen regulatory IIA component
MALGNGSGNGGGNDSGNGGVAIGDLLDASQVSVGLRVADKAQLLAELAQRAATALSLPPTVVLRALQAREQLGSTGLGKGFALPHARLGNLPRPYALLLRLARPIDFAAIDDRPVDLVVLLLTPDSAGGQHLAALAALARPFRDDRLVQRLREAPSAAVLHRALCGVP